MPETIPISSKTLPAGFCPTTEQERLNAFAAALVGTTAEATSLFIIQAATPPISDKVWFRLLPDGSIDKAYKVVDGAWKSRHPVMVGATILWTGPQADIVGLDGGTAGVATIDSGPFWEEVTAAIGRVAVHPDPNRTLIQFQQVTPSGGGAPINNIAVGGTGGEERHSLLGAENGPHSHIINQFLGGIAGGAGIGVWTTGTGTQGTSVSGSGDPHQNMPPFIGMFHIRRTQRIFYRQ